MFNVWTNRIVYAIITNWDVSYCSKNKVRQDRKKSRVEPYPTGTAASRAYAMPENTSKMVKFRNKLCVYCTEKSLFIGLFNLQLILNDLPLLCIWSVAMLGCRTTQITYSKELTQLISNSTIHSGELGKSCWLKTWLILFKGLAWLCLTQCFYV